MNSVKRFGWVLAVVVLGCGSTDVTATGPAQTPRALTCDFEILTSTPLRGYKEIGTIDVTPGGYGVNVFTTLGDFKNHIRTQVCQLGGDAAIAAANGYGMYIKASVLKRVAAEPPAPVADSDAPRGKSHGCEFDSQCKGDRICVEGSCQEPAPKPVAPAETAPAPSATQPAVAPSALPPTPRVAPAAAH